MSRGFRVLAVCRRDLLRNERCGLFPVTMMGEFDPYGVGRGSDEDEEIGREDERDMAREGGRPPRAAAHSLPSRASRWVGCDPARAVSLDNMREREREREIERERERERERARDREREREIERERERERERTRVSD